jgi:hypothetical protein
MKSRAMLHFGAAATTKKLPHLTRVITGVLQRRLFD